MRNIIAVDHAGSRWPFGTDLVAQGNTLLGPPNHLSEARPQTAPRELSLSFTQDLEPAFSTVEVRDANGARVDQGKAQVSASVMHVGLKPLPPGTYKVHWHVLSVDTHTTEGSFSFQVGH